MLLAQVLVPAAFTLSVLFSAWFALDSRRARTGVSADAPARMAASPRLRAFDSLALALLVAIGLLAASGTAAVFEDGPSAAILAGISVSSGAAVTILAALLTPHLPRAAAQDDSSLVVGLGAAAAPVLLASGLTLGAISGLFVLATRILDFPPGQAPYLLAGIALGAATVAVFLELLVVSPAGSVDPSLSPESGEQSGADPGPAADTRARPFRLVVPAVPLSAIHALGLAATLILGSSLHGFTGDLEWMLLPLVLSALLIALLVPLVLGSQLLVMRGFGPPATVDSGLFVAALFGSLGGALLTWRLVEGGWEWFAACFAVGATGGALLPRLTGPARASSGAPLVLERRALAVLGLASVLLLGGILGSEANVSGASSALVGLYGVAIAVCGMVIPVSFITITAVMVSAVPTGAGEDLSRPALNVAGMPPPEIPARPPGQAPSAIAEIATSGRHLLSAAVAVIGVLAFLEGVRLQIADQASSDPARYAALVQDLGLIPPGDDQRFAAANTIARRAATMSEAGLEGWHARVLSSAGSRAEHEGAITALVDSGELTRREAATIEPAMPPMSRPLPVSLARPITVAGLLAGLAGILLATGLFARTDHRTRQTGAPGTVLTVVAVLLAAAAPAALAVAARWVAGGDGNEGWLIMAALVSAGILGSVLLAAASLPAGQTPLAGLASRDADASLPPVPSPRSVGPAVAVLVSAVALVCSPLLIG